MMFDELRKIAGANMADYMKSTTDRDPYLDFRLEAWPDHRALMSAARARPPRSALADASASSSACRHRHIGGDGGASSIWPACAQKMTVGPGNG